MALLVRCSSNGFRSYCCLDLSTMVCKVSHWGVSVFIITFIDLIALKNSSVYCALFFSQSTNLCLSVCKIDESPKKTLSSVFCWADRSLSCLLIARLEISLTVLSSTLNSYRSNMTFFTTSSSDRSTLIWSFNSWLEAYKPFFSSSSHYYFFPCST